MARVLLVSLVWLTAVAHMWAWFWVGYLLEVGRYQLRPSWWEAPFVLTGIAAVGAGVLVALMLTERLTRS